jgi:hypothetical protein
MPKHIKLIKHENPSNNDWLTDVSVRELKYSLVPIENASANRLENPINTTEFFDTFPAMPPAIITKDVIKPSIDPNMLGLNILLFFTQLQDLNSDAMELVAMEPVKSSDSLQTVLGFIFSRVLLWIPSEVVCISLL